MSLFRTISLSVICAALAIGCASRPEHSAVANSAAPQPPVLPISQSARGVEITLPDSVLFASGKADLEASLSAPYLDRLARLLTTKTEKRILVEGHTDATGGDELNRRLSMQRAQSVAEALIARGVPGARIETTGLASTRPVAPNDVEAGRRLNRRSEVIVLGETVENIAR
ncbi:MAG: OmpA family protein, partial [Burkholderiales bacterium]